MQPDDEQVLIDGTTWAQEFVNGSDDQHAYEIIAAIEAAARARDMSIASVVVACCLALSRQIERAPPDCRAESLAGILTLIYEGVHVAPSPIKETMQ